jgi:ABC-2 type transport system permease protein
LIGVDEHDLRQTNVKWLNYQVIPVLVLLVLNVGLTGTALLCGQDIERKTSRYLVLCPQQSWMLVAGRLLGGFVASLLALIPALGLCICTGVVAPPADHWAPLLAIFAATALCAAGFGAILGTVLSGARTIAMAASVTASYLFFLGGGFTTIAFLPQWLRTLSAFVPIRYSIDGMRQALFYSSLDGITRDLEVLCATALIACAIGSLLVRRSWK